MRKPPRLRAGDTVGLVAPGGEDDDWERGPQPADLAEDRKPVAAREHQVQQ